MLRNPIHRTGAGVGRPERPEWRPGVEGTLPESKVKAEGVLVDDADLVEPGVERVEE